MATGFSRLKVSGFRRLRAVDVELRPFNVLIGANGVGKSSVIDTIDLLAATAEGVLEKSLSDVGGISSLLTADGQSRSIQLKVAVPFAQAELVEYDLRISESGIGYNISRELLTYQNLNDAGPPVAHIDAVGQKIEYLDIKEDRLVAPAWSGYKRFETLLSQMPQQDSYQYIIRAVLSNVSDIYHNLGVSQNAPIRLPQPLQPADVPASDGSLLLASLYTLRETQRDRYEAIEDSLRAAFPTFERLDLPLAAAGRVTLAWKDQNFTSALYPHQLSEGTLRFLWLITLLHSKNLPSIVMIDEPEISLHPEMLRLLAELMREASQRTQLIVTTHSDRFVRFLNPDELVICDLTEDGGMTATRGSAIDLEAWLNEYTLDELWSMGRLGGRS